MAAYIYLTGKAHGMAAAMYSPDYTHRHLGSWLWQQTSDVDGKVATLLLTAREGLLARAHLLVVIIVIVLHRSCARIKLCKRPRASWCQLHVPRE